MPKASSLANSHPTGLISTYELSGKQHPELIERAKDLGNKLSVAWSAQVGRLSFFKSSGELASCCSLGDNGVRLTWRIVGLLEYDHPLRRIKLYDRYSGDCYCQYPILIR